ncbi:unnamed protein product [Prorocentrum cordatum]|uniref:Phosphoglycerate mutase (2,3-diphosphoglycerate-dependent) n=1 Tax=Prorocentrum cordatum TaxID=2364126 RepID=A0ABN9RXL2_9DINO|nr:unnamed protein product [Polarella glacialis]
MYGTHVQVAIHTLTGYGVDKSAILSFSYIAATPDLLIGRPTVEHDLNVAFTPTLEALQGIFGQAQLTLTLRLVKLLLNLPGETLAALVDWMATERPDVLKVVCKAIEDEDLKGTEQLNSRTSSSLAKSSSTQTVIEPRPGPLAPAVLVRHGQSVANVAKESNIYEYLYRKFADRSLVDAGLTPQGEDDARRVGAELFWDGCVAPSDVGLVVLSPLSRALRTASLALEAAGVALPEMCRVVAHPLAAGRFFSPDIAENLPAAEALRVAEGGGPAGGLRPLRRVGRRGVLRGGAREAPAGDGRRGGAGRGGTARLHLVRHSGRHRGPGLLPRGRHPGAVGA